MCVFVFDYFTQKYQSIHIRKREKKGIYENKLGGSFIMMDAGVT